MREFNKAVCEHQRTVFDDPQKGSEGMEMGGRWFLVGFLIGWFIIGPILFSAIGAAMNYPDDDAWDDFDDDDATDGGDE